MPSTTDEEDETSDSNSRQLFKKTLAAFSFQTPSPKTGSSTTPKRLHITNHTEPSSSNTTHSSETDIKPKQPRSIKSKRGFAPADRYSHLKPLQDYLQPNLDIVFCGIKYYHNHFPIQLINGKISPGQKSAEIGHHFGGPTNHFWPCLYESNLTTERLQPTQDFTLPERFSIGLTNLVNRPTAEQNELSREEQISAIPLLLNKIILYKPRILCFVGLGITKIVKSQVLPSTLMKKRNKSGGEKELESTYGLQPFKIVHCDTSETLFFAVSSTSGRVVKYQKTHKIEQFRELKNLLEKVKAGEFDSSGVESIQYDGGGSDV